MQSMVKIHSLDNVAVALRDLAADETLMLDGTAIRLAQPVARGHKFALRPIAAGEAIIKYGLPIGHALETIASGVHIHSQNAKTNLSDLDSYQYQPQFSVLPPQAADQEVQLYRRSSGEVGSATSCGSYRPLAVSTALPDRSSSVSSRKPRMRRGSTACTCSVIRLAAPNWGKIMRTPALCCKTWCAIPMPARCW